MSATIIPDYIGLGISVVAAIGGIGLSIANYLLLRNPDLVALRRGRSRLTCYFIFAMVALIIMYAAFLMLQGTYIRTDAVEAYWGRFAAYAVADALMALAVAEWFWHYQYHAYAAAASLVIYRGLHVFASLSVSPNNWIWFGISFPLGLLPAFFIVIFLSNKAYRPIWKTALIFLLLVIFNIAYPIITGLGHAFGLIISLVAESYVYVGLDLFYRVIGFIILYFTYCPKDRRVAEDVCIDSVLYDIPKMKNIQKGPGAAIPFMMNFFTGISCNGTYPKVSSARANGYGKL